jgi:hypothetical protein
VLLDGARECGTFAGEPVVLELRLRRRLLVRDAARVPQDLALAELEEVVELGDPVRHVHRLPVEGLQLGELEVGRGTSPVQLVRPMFGRVASARMATISAAVWPCPAQCILFWTIWKNLADPANNRGAVELAFLEDVLDVPGGDGLVALEQLGHLPERQPGRLAIEADLSRWRSVNRIVR